MARVAQDALAGEADGERGVALARCVSVASARCRWTGGMVLLSPGAAVPPPARVRRDRVGQDRDGAAAGVDDREVVATRPCSTSTARAIGRPRSRFCGLMADAGRRTRVFPNEPFDGWRGQPHEIHGRLMEIIDYSSEGPAAWYRDVAKNVLRLVCEHPDGPPRSSAGRARADGPRRAAGGARGVERAGRADAPSRSAQVRLRYEAFFGQTRGALDGELGVGGHRAPPTCCWTVSRCARRRAGLARFLFEDFAHYFTTRKPREPVLRC